MSEYTNNRIKVAKWLVDNRKQADWWRWQVLTKHNPDESNLKIPDEDASLIFADFIHAGLLLPTMDSDGQGAHAINEAKLNEWQEVAQPLRWWIRRHLFQLLCVSPSTFGVNTCAGFRMLVGRREFRKRRQERSDLWQFGLRRMPRRHSARSDSAADSTPATFTQRGASG